MKLNYITFMVRDIEKSAKFYQDLVQLSIVRQFTADAGEIMFLANAKGETMIELIEFEGVEKVETKGMVLSFTASDELEVLKEKAISLGYSTSEIIDKGPKPKYFTATDPDGIIVEFSV